MLIRNSREYNDPNYGEHRVANLTELNALPKSPKNAIGTEVYVEAEKNTYTLGTDNNWGTDKDGSELLGKVSIDQTTAHANEIVIKTVGSAITHTDILVGVISTVVLVANASRKYALLVNDSDTTVYIKIGSAASLNSGIRINPNGGSYEMSAIYGNLDTRVINAISSVAGKLLLVTEGE